MAKIINGRMSIREGTAALGLSERQVIRLKKKYKSGKGAQELIHKDLEKRIRHALPNEVKERIVDLYTAKYLWEQLLLFRRASAGA